VRDARLPPRRALPPRGAAPARDLLHAQVSGVPAVLLAHARRARRGSAAVRRRPARARLRARRRRPEDGARAPARARRRAPARRVDPQDRAPAREPDPRLPLGRTGDQGREVHPGGLRRDADRARPGRAPEVLPRVRRVLLPGRGAGRRPGSPAPDVRTSLRPRDGRAHARVPRHRGRRRVGPKPEHERQSSDALREAIANYDELARELAGTDLAADLGAELALA
jgi:hypothetical protein